jgi:hypothetical protein
MNAPVSPRAPGARDDVTSRRAAWLAALGVVALVLVAFALRVRGIDSSLPHAPEIHERVFFAQVSLLERGTANPEQDLDFGFYPQFVARLCTWFPATRPAEPHTLAEHLRAAAVPRLHIRWVSMLLSLVILPATYLVARRFLARGTALLAVAFVATSWLHVWFAQQGRPHAPAAGLALLALVAVLRVRERATFAAYLVAGVALAIALATLQNAAALFPAFLVAHLLRREGGSRFAHAGFAVALGFVAIAVRVFYPFMFAQTGGHDAASLSVREGTFVLSGHAIDLSAFRGTGFAVLARALWDYETLLLGLGLASASVWLWRAWKRKRAAPRERTHSPTTVGLLTRWRERARGHEAAVVVGCHVATYVLVFGAYGKTLERFALPLVPYVAIVAAAGVVALAGRMAARCSSRRLARVCGVAPIAVAALLQGGMAEHVSALCAAPDTYEHTAEWIERNCDRANTKLSALTSTYLPLMRDDAGLASVAHMYPTWIDSWLAYQAQLSHAARATHAWRLKALPLHSSAELHEMATDVGKFVHTLDADYVVIEDADGRKPPLRRRYIEALRRGLQQELRLVARSSPWPAGDESDLPFGYTSIGQPTGACWAFDALRARALGPVIEIYAPR